MLTLCLIILFGITYSSTDPEIYEENYIYDGSFNVRNIIDVSYYKIGYLPNNIRYIFRIPAYEDDKLEVNCYVYRDAKIEFKVDVCAYLGKPSKNVVYSTIVLQSAPDYCRFNIPKTSVSWEEYDGLQYDIHSYKFETLSNVDYVAVGVKNQFSLHYLAIKIYSEKGMALAILLLIILLPVILVIGLVVFLLRRCGCIVTVSSSSI